jgi:FlaA1/EpsC-like NDP-sugar epimerase
VNPTSVMGAAKRVAELLVMALDASGRTRFVVVRFGNVLGSNGSVVPRFLSQIAHGGPVTVTHPEMRRYFMLIPEAVQLVLHAAAINDRGSIFVLEMGEQVRVADMARDLIRLSGYIPDKEIAVAFTGVRPGEKFYEELIGEGELAEPSPVPKILKVNCRVADPHVLLEELVNTLEQAAFDGLDDTVIEQLCKIVPSFAPTRRPSPLHRA